jgi:hypothetical protein
MAPSRATEFVAYGGASRPAKSAAYRCTRVESPAFAKAVKSVADKKKYREIIIARTSYAYEQVRCFASPFCTH